MDYENEFKYMSIVNLMDKTYHKKKYSIERAKIHEKIIDDHFVDKNNQNNKVNIIFMTGCYGSGKSYVLETLFANNFLERNKYVYVDIDYIRTLLPEIKEQMNNLLSFHDIVEKTNCESKYIAEIIERKAIIENYNVIIDGSHHHNWCHNIYIPWIKKINPTIFILLLYVNVSLETILKRIILRERTVPVDILKEVHDKVSKNINYLKNSVDKVIEINNENHFYAEKYENDLRCLSHKENSIKYQSFN
ncbi:MAG: hypothetical protein Terrestrivirus2_147 [Terrestrivirus sp.]|uniref:Zeta toxin domain-containing protein n=1 Tax=Terrestrivirus sp. TaxID=2487775 RepID=A0A3G4ZQC0_9VIRU|nr:MAG: hypothetical protein Terrestrivirus2_147 [Terrestrivirus sp.]